jgi:hypothetical protein
MTPGRAIRDAATQKERKNMEFNTIMQALVKDMAEQLRPMVREMIQAELVTGHLDLAAIAENVNLSQLAEHISLVNLAGELTDSQLTLIAGDIDLADLAGEFDGDKLADKIDLDSAINDWFADQSFTIKP